MPKKFCIFCEMPSGNINNPYYWIHKKCFEKINDESQNYKGILKMLAENKTIQEIKEYIQKMNKFDKKWDNTMKYIEQVYGVKT